MNFRFSFSILILLFSLNGFSQETSVATNNSVSRKVISEGFGIRVAKPFLTMQSDALYINTDDRNLDQSFAAALTYSRLLAGEFGWTSNLHLMK